MSSPGSGAPVALLDRLDALVEQALVGLEGRGSARRGDDLALAAARSGTFTIAAQVLRQHHVRERAEHGDQLGDVDELREARHRLVLAGGLQLEFGRGVAEGGRPGVELVQAALAQRRWSISRCRVNISPSVLVIGVPEASTSARPGFFVSTKRDFTNRSQARCEPFGSTPCKRRHVGGEGELAELLRLVDDDLVDADLRDREQVVLARRERLQPLLVALLHALDALARERGPRVSIAVEQLLIELELVLRSSAARRRTGRG